MAPVPASADAWGDIPTWVSAIGTLVALVFAAVAANAARRVYLIESARDEVTAQERRGQAEFLRRSQAALVSVWWGNSEDRSGASVWGAFVRNASETPTYQNRISVVSADDPDTNDSFGLSVLPPGSEPVFLPSRMTDNSPNMGGGGTNITVEMTFTDSTGTRWIRDKNGRLFEVPPNLTIWTDNQRTLALELFSQDFLADHHVTASFRCPPIETMQEEFVAAVASGEEPPDILIGPHDWIGMLAERELIQPIVLPEERRSAFVARALAAMTYRGELYGIPYAADVVGLLRNVDLAPDAPGSVEEMLEQGRLLCAAGRAERPLVVQVGAGDGFYIYPLYSSLGGRIFARAAEDIWDVDSMAGAAARNAFTRLADLGERGEGVLCRDIDRDRAIELFVTGRTPFLICAPWAVESAREADIRIAVSPVPPFVNASPSQSLVAVHGFFFPASGKNTVIARDLVLDFLTRLEVAKVLHETQPRPSALVAAAEFAAADGTTAYRELFESGELIPSTPDVASVWKVFHRAETGVIAGEPLDVVMRDLARSIENLNTRT